jgi:predicted class III extradiol MEMO1 family dioxygenase
MDYIDYIKNCNESYKLNKTLSELSDKMMFIKSSDLQHIQETLEKLLQESEINTDRIQKNVLPKNSKEDYFNIIKNEKNQDFNFIPIGVWLATKDKERPRYYYRTNIIYFDEETQDICKIHNICSLKKNIKREVTEKL